MPTDLATLGLKIDDRSIPRANRNLTELERHARRAEVAAGQFGTGAAQGFGRAALAMKGLLTTAALGAGVSLLTLPRHLKAAVDEASKFVNLSDRIGVTTGELQELAHAASLADVEFQSLAGGMQFFSRQLGEATAGNGELHKILQLNRVALRDGNGNLRSTNELLMVFADLVANAESESAQLALAQAAFGRGGLEMVSVLRGGSAALNEQMGEAQRLGLVLDDELLRRTEEIGDRWSTMTARIGTNWKEMLLQLASTSGRFVNSMRPIDQWFGERFGIYMTAEEAAAARLKRTLDPTVDEAGFSAGKFMTGIDFDARFTGADAPAPTKLPPSSTPEDDNAAMQAQKRIEDTVRALQFQQEQVARNAREQMIFNEVQQAGVEITSSYGMSIATAAGRLYDLETAQQRATESAELFGNTLFDALDAIIGRGEDAGQVILNLIKQMALAQAKAGFMNLLSPGSSQAGPISLIGSFLSGLGGGGATGAPMNLLPSARGNVFSRGRVVPFRMGGVVNEPSVFQMRNGGLGSIAEEDPEAILPLRRGPDGRLGVDGGGGRQISVNVNVQASDVASFRRSSGQISAMMANAVRRASRMS